MKNLISIICALAFYPSISNAISVEWWFTNSGETWTNTETISLEATLMNTGIDPVELGNNETGISGAILSYGSFPASPSNRQYRFFFRYHGALTPDESFFLQPGESIDFIFGEFVPQVAIIENGSYETFGVGLTVNSVAYTFSENYFSATVVPLPASIWLFGSGIACLLVNRRKQQA
jgi:hypothetical protein